MYVEVHLLTSKDGLENINELIFHRKLVKFLRITTVYLLLRHIYKDIYIEFSSLLQQNKRMSNTTALKVSEISFIINWDFLKVRAFPVNGVLSYLVICDKTAFLHIVKRIIIIMKMREQCLIRNRYVFK